MQLSMQAVTFFVGLALIIVGIFGGGIEVKEIKIPTLPLFPRSLSFGVGLVLIVFCLAFPHLFPGSSAPVALAASTPSPTPTLPSAGDKPKFLGAAIQNRLVTVREVKQILRHANKYAGPLDDEPNDAYFQAVGEFQVSQNIAADGLVGPVTYAKLRESWPEYFATKPAP